jgi:hypothetical protein
MKTKAPKRFRMRGKEFLLTYINCKEVALLTIRTLLQHKFKEIGIKDYLIIRQLNKFNKEQNHCHAVLILNKVKDIRSTNYLDLVIGGDLKLHGNYQLLKHKSFAVK